MNTNINKQNDRSNLDYVGSWEVQDIVTIGDEEYLIVSISDKWVAKLQLLNHPEFPNDYYKMNIKDEKEFAAKKTLQQKLYLIKMEYVESLKEMHERIWVPK